MSCPLKRLMELTAHFSETDRRPKNIMLRLPYTEQNFLEIQQYDADFDKQKLYTVKVDYTKNIMNLPTKEELNALRDECYKIACEHGWHDEKHSERHFLCLVITELSEAVEADRIDRHADLESLNDAASVYPWVRCFATYVKDTVEDELADAAIRILDLAGLQDCDIGESVEIKLCYDDEATQDHTPLRDHFRTHTFTEAVFVIVEKVILGGYDSALTALFLLADVMGFDLMEHIRLKIEYNKTRERLHGKRY